MLGGVALPPSIAVSMLILFLEGSRAGTVAEVPFIVARDLLAAGRARRPDEIVLTMQREAAPDVAPVPKAHAKRRGR